MELPFHENVFITLQILYFYYIYNIYNYILYFLHLQTDHHIDLIGFKQSDYVLSASVEIPGLKNKSLLNPMT